MHEHYSLGVSDVYCIKSKLFSVSALLPYVSYISNLDTCFNLLNKGLNQQTDKECLTLQVKSSGCISVFHIKYEQVHNIIDVHIPFIDTHEYCTCNRFFVFMIDFYDSPI